MNIMNKIEWTAEYETKHLLNLNYRLPLIFLQITAAKMQLVRDV